MPPNGQDGSVRPLSFRTARRPASERRRPDRRGRNPCRRRTAPNFAWFGKKTATLYRVAAPADPVLVRGNRLGGAKGPQPGPPSLRRAAMRAAAVKCRTAAVDGGYAMVAVWKSNLVGSDIDPLHGVFGERRQPWLGAPGFCGTLALRRHHPICSGEHFPDRVSAWLRSATAAIASRPRSSNRPSGCISASF